MLTFNLHKTHFFVGQNAYNTGVGGSGPNIESTLPDHRWLKSSDFENIALRSGRSAFGEFEISRQKLIWNGSWTAFSCLWG